MNHTRETLYNLALYNKKLKTSYLYLKYYRARGKHKIGFGLEDYKRRYETEYHFFNYVIVLIL
jgi:hypothetical protein